MAISQTLMPRNTSSSPAAASYAPNTLNAARVSKVAQARISPFQQALTGAAEHIKSDLQEIQRYFTTVYAIPNVLATISFYLANISFLTPFALNIGYIIEIIKPITKLVSIHFYALGAIGLLANMLQIPFTAFNLNRALCIRNFTNKFLKVENFNFENEIGATKEELLRLKGNLVALQKEMKSLSLDCIRRDDFDYDHIETKKISEHKGLKTAEDYEAFESHLKSILAAIHELHIDSPTNDRVITESVLTIRNTLKKLKNASLKVALEYIDNSFVSAHSHITTNYNLPGDTRAQLIETKKNRLQEIVGRPCADFICWEMQEEIQTTDDGPKVTKLGLQILYRGLNEDSPHYTKLRQSGVKIFTHLNQKTLELILIHSIAIIAMSLAIVGTLGVLIGTMPPAALLLIIATSSILHITNYIIKRSMTYHEGHYLSFAHLAPNWISNLAHRQCASFCPSLAEMNSKDLPTGKPLDPQPEYKKCSTASLPLGTPQTPLLA